MLLRNSLQDRFRFPGGADSWTPVLRPPRAYPSIWEFAVCLNRALNHVVLLIDYCVYGLSTLVSELLVRIY